MGEDKGTLEKSRRPWVVTPEDVERDGVWADYAAFERWWYETVEETLPDCESSIWDGMSVSQQSHVYVCLCKFFDGDRPGERG